MKGLDRNWGGGNGVLEKGTTFGAIMQGPDENRKQGELGGRRAGRGKMALI